MRRLDAHGLVLEYRDGERCVRAVDGVDVQARAGEFVGLVGPSGSGKSSLLFLLAGLRRPDGGTVTINGVVLDPLPDRNAAIRREHVGFLFQEPFLVPWMSVMENALVHALDPERAAARVRDLAGRIGMGALLEERPDRLSGGERQRAGILRALANEPGVVLADEPTAALDGRTGQAVMAMLREAAREAALVVVTHDPAMLTGADRVLRLSDGAVVEG
jgi:putative ABC transport system ATP-binding protein